MLKYICKITFEVEFGTSDTINKNLSLSLIILLFIFFFKLIIFKFFGGREKCTWFDISNATLCRKLSKMKLTRKRLSLMSEEKTRKKKLMLGQYTSMNWFNFARIIGAFKINGLNTHRSRLWGYYPANNKPNMTVSANKNINMCY